MISIRSVVFGGLLATMCRDFVSAEIRIILPLYQYPLVAPATAAPMWVALKAAAEAGHEIAGILNPASGPNAVGGDLTNYKYVVNNFLNKGNDQVDPNNPIATLTIICYVSTAFGNTNTDTPFSKPKEAVEADISAYEEIFPGVCDGIFFDEAARDLTDETNELTDTGILYQGYNDYVRAVLGTDKKVMFNPGLAADPAYFGFEGSPAVMGFENFYRVMRNVGVPRPPSGVDNPSQHAMLVHTTAPDLDVDTDSEATRELVQAIVQEAECNGWGQIYLTSDSFLVGSPVTPELDGNPWNVLTNYWDFLVEGVYGLPAPPRACPNTANPQLTLIVPLHLASSIEESNAMINSILSQGVLSSSDYVGGDSVSIILDAGINEDQALMLRDAGAKVLCYFDFAGFAEAWQLNDAVYSAFVKPICGGFYVDNYDDSTLTEQQADDQVAGLYASVQNSVPGGTLVLNPTEPGTVNLFTKDWSEASFQEGPVIVATVFDAAASTTTPFPIPVPAADASRVNSALIVTGFTETSSETLECLLAEINESYAYGYVTDDLGRVAEPASEPPVTFYFGRLSAEVDDPTVSVGTCNAPPPTPEPTAAPTASPTTASPTAVPTAGPTIPVPAPTTPANACGSESEARIRWNNRARRIIVIGPGCADLTRMSAFFDGQDIAGPPLLDRGAGVWELDATIDVRRRAVVKLVGEVAGGECNELRLLTDNTGRRRVTVFGNGGFIFIQNTKVIGWMRRTGAVDGAESRTRAFVRSVCTFCPTPAARCGMTVIDSEISHLGSGGLMSSGLVWTTTCDTPNRIPVATAQGVTSTGNRRGIYAFGMDLAFEELTIAESGAEGILVDTCAGFIRASTVTQPKGGPAYFGMVVQRSDGIEISNNTLAGDKGLFLEDSVAACPDVTTVADNDFQPSANAVRIGTSNTEYTGNAGDAQFDSTWTLGLVRLTEGCFTAESSSDNAYTQAYIASNACDACGA